MGRGETNVHDFRFFFHPFQYFLEGTVGETIFVGKLRHLAAVTHLN